MQEKNGCSSIYTRVTFQIDPLTFMPPFVLLTVQLLNKCKRVVKATQLGQGAPRNEIVTIALGDCSRYQSVSLIGVNSVLVAVRATDQCQRCVGSS